MDGADKELGDFWLEEGENLKSKNSLVECYLSAEASNGLVCLYQPWAQKFLCF